MTSLATSLRSLSKRQAGGANGVVTIKRLDRRSVRCDDNSMIALHRGEAKRRRRGSGAAGTLDMLINLVQTMSYFHAGHQPKETAIF
jgi:hypothetical protein